MYGWNDVNKKLYAKYSDRAKLARAKHKHNVSMKFLKDNINKFYEHEIKALKKNFNLDVEDMYEKYKDLF